jgi:opacity protein-like surface antigen
MRKLWWWGGVSAFLLSGFVVTSAQAQSARLWDWTGFYAGFHVGNAGVRNDWKDVVGPLAGAQPFDGQFTSGGILRGAQLGYNYQRNRIVIGLEADVDSTDIDGPARCAIAVYVCNAKIDALGTITARFGYAYDKFLFFGKAGAAWAHETLDLTPSPKFGATSLYLGTQLRWGWTVGAGAEYAFTPTMSAKVEYNYLDLGDIGAGMTDQSGSALTVTLAQQVHLIKLGLNFKLGQTSPFDAPSGAPALMPSSSWSGFYGGVNVGGGWGMSNWKSADGLLATASTSSFPGSGTADGLIAGGQIGTNYQFGSWVAGVEVSASWANFDGYAKCATTESPFRSYACRSSIDNLVTVTGRLGQAYGDLLIYGVGGAAWARENHEAYRNDGSVNRFTGESTRAGYMLGAGLEYAFTPAWSGKLEYDYIDFGTKTLALTDQFGNTSNVAIGQQLNLVKMGLNYKFGADPWAPAPAKTTGGLFLKAPPPLSDWAIEAGLRYWYSNGKMQQDLYDSVRTSLVNSRLIYGDMNGHSAETFVRFDHVSGLFVKGNFGIGSLVNGNLHDEDFPPYESPYSNTLHRMREGSLRNGSLDIGRNLIDGPAGKLGPFIGYRYFYQRGRAFGCAQVASNTMCATPDPDNQVALTETETWRGPAVGLNTQMALSPRWRLEVDAAYLPYVDRAGVDNHWNRADINPGPETGHGWATQFEAILSYAVTDRLSIGVGGRYWYFTTVDGASQFPNSVAASPLKFTSERYGGFLQASYKIGDTGLQHRATAEQVPAVDWSGFYVGGRLGAGFGRNDWSDPFPPPPTGDRVRTGGALAGGQFGVNYQTGKMVIGAEMAGMWSRLEGTETCFGGFVPATNAGVNCENKYDALATLTGRLGIAVDHTLFYAKGGAALAYEKYTLNSNGITGGSISSTSATNWGWTAGAGVEQALNSRWSVSLEYNYLDFGSRAVRSRRRRPKRSAHVCKL